MDWQNYFLKILRWYPAKMFLTKHPRELLRILFSAVSGENDLRHFEPKQVKFSRIFYSPIANNQKIKTMDKSIYDQIAKEISSDESPVGIDAKKTHIIIIEKLMRIEERLNELEKKMQ